jgi:hypothetical protein
VLVTWLVRSAGWETVGEGARLGLALWAMPVVLLGSTVHEGARSAPQRSTPATG